MRGRLEGKALAAQIIARGNDGVSPIVSVESIEGGHRITIEDIRGTKSFDVKDGEGLNVLGSYASEEELKAAHPTGEAGNAYFVNSNLFLWDEAAKMWIDVGQVKGEKGDKGDTGADGHTPVKGIDYFTESEKQEIIEEAAESAKPTDYVKDTGDTMEGALVAQNNTSYTTKQVRNIFLVAEGEDLPSGSNGDICLVYAP